MAANSNIEWCDHTHNAWIGCTKVSPGCDNCYAERREDQRLHRVHWGTGQPRHRTKTQGDPVRWNKQHAKFFALHGRRQRVFCSSLSDVFDNEVDPQWRVDLFRLIAATPNLDWLLLTKRIGNAWPMMLEVSRRCGGGEQPMANVWLGATVVNQAEADRDIPKLLATPAAVRFLSIEPMLGAIDLVHWIGREPAIGASTYNDGTTHRCDLTNTPVDGLHWVIAGGESGPKARPSHSDWYRSLRDQCAAAGVPFLFKQWGDWAPYDRGAVDTAQLTTAGALDEPLQRLGKKAAGRLLDGRTHDGFPGA